MNTQKLNQLKSKLHEKAHLASISALISWDQETYMPQDAIHSRSDQSALLAKLIHEHHTSAEFKALLSDLVDLSTGESLDTTTSPLDKRLLKEIHRDWKLATCLPNDFVQDYSQAKSLSQHAWQHAKKNKNFAEFQPHLEKVIHLTQKKASYINASSSAYDTLLDEYEPELTTAELTPILEKLKTQTLALLSTRSTSSAVFDFKAHSWDLDKQWKLSEKIISDMRLNLKEARLDKSTHPFSSQIHPTDVRITTRLDLHNPFENWSSTMHECGHALYEQGLDKTHFGTPFCEALSFGIHESQSRLWENGIGKHPDFWAHYYPLWQSYFPEILKNVPFSSFFSALCEVKPSLIRTQSDELTYNLHIWIRYQLELAVFNGHLSVADLPHEWNKAYTELLGVTPKDDTEGILQDVHWSCGYFGYFPTYSLGNLYAAMLLETLDQSLPLSQHLKTGTLLPIRDWLKTNIHQKGRSVPAKTLIQDITGKPLTETAFVHMMKRRLSV